MPESTLYYQKKLCIIVGKEKGVEMMKSLVLAEKPSVGKDIARVLQCKKTISGGLEGEKYIVTWAFGHLVTLADPEQYEDRYKTWKIFPCCQNR